MPVGITLLDHQRRMVEVARTRARYCFFHKPGCGKTIGALAVCEAMPMKTIVVCPRSVMRPAWIDDARHFPALNIACLWSGSKAERIHQIREQDWDIGVINFESFKLHAADLAACGVRRMIFDESAKCKSHTSGITKAAHSFADRMESVYMLSGTPAPNNATEYWGQLRAVSIAAAGPSYFRFAYKFATPIKRTYRAPGGVWKEGVAGWTQTDAQRAALAKLLSGLAWFLSKEEVMDLPEKSDRTIDVFLSSAEHAAYAAAHKSMVLLAKNGEPVAKIKGAASFHKCRQITGGAALMNGEPVPLGESKMKALSELLESIGPQPVVIWAEFTHEIRGITAALAGIRETKTLDGSTSGDAGGIVAWFQSAESTMNRALICQPQAAAHGVTLTAASHAVFFSCGFSAELHEQARDRIYRYGQRNACTYHYLVAPGTVDVAAVKVVRRKMTESEAIKQLVEVEELRHGGPH